MEKIIIPLLKYNLNKNNFKFFLSDGAAYCRKLGKYLKEKYNFLHIICVCHNIHNFCEYLRDKHDEIENLVAFLKRILVKNQ